MPLREIEKLNWQEKAIFNLENLDRQMAEVPMYLNHPVELRLMPNFWQIISTRPDQTKIYKILKEQILP